MFNRAVAAGIFADATVSLRWSNQLYISDQLTANGTTSVVAHMVLSDASVGPNVCNYQPPPADLVDAITGGAVQAWVNFPVTI